MSSKIALCMAVILCGLFLPARGAQAGEPVITGEAAVLLDVSSGQFLYEKNPDRQLYPASTTKVLTALIAVKNGNLNDRVTMSDAAVYAGGSAIWSTVGEQFTLEELLWCMLLNSANDAATAVAEHLGGSVEGFAAMMNAEARRLGAENSNFVNPHGLHDDRHYTTARDLALIGRAALEEPLIVQMAATKTHQVSREDPEALSLLVNTNKLLWRYEGAVGLKTGYTSQAGQCLIAVAEREGRTLLSVVLKSENDRIWTDTAGLLDYGFERFREVVLVEEGEQVCLAPVVHGDGTAALRTGDRLTHVVPVDQPVTRRWEVRLDRELAAPLERGETVGVLAVFSGGTEIGQVPLVVGTEVNRAAWAGWWYRGGLLAGGLWLLWAGVRASARRRLYRPRR